MARSGIRVQGLSGLAANFRAFDREVGRGVREVVRQNGIEQHAETEAAAPRDTGFTADHTRLEFSPGGLAYTVGYDPADYAAAGKDFYVLYLIFGTRFIAANNWPLRVHEARAPKLTRDVGDVLRGAARSVSR